MNYEAYEKLEKAIMNNELEAYLLAMPEYRLSSFSDPNFPIMNDYRTLVIALNDYGKLHPDFSADVRLAVLKCLERGTPGACYNILNIVREQLILEKNKANSIDFLDKEIYEKLKNIVQINKDFFENYKEYEGMLYSNGMNGAISKWDEEIYSYSGNRIM